MDVEDKGRVWGKIPEDLDETNTTWLLDPIVVAVDKDDNVYARQLLSKYGGEAAKIVEDNEFLYIAGFFAPTPEDYGPENPGDRGIFINKIPKSWVVNKESKAKDTRIG